MASLTFVAASNEAKKAAMNGNGFTSRISAFRDGVTFKITGFDYVEAQEDGKIKAVCPVFKTTIGDLFMSRLTRRYVDKDGNTHSCGGNLVDTLFEVITKNRGKKSDGEMFTEVCKKVKDKTITVTLHPYIKETKYGTMPADVADFNF